MAVAIRGMRTVRWAGFGKSPALSVCLQVLQFTQSHAARILGITPPVGTCLPRMAFCCSSTSSPLLSLGGAGQHLGQKRETWEMWSESKKAMLQLSCCCGSMFRLMTCKLQVLHTASWASHAGAAGSSWARKQSLQSVSFFPAFWAAGPARLPMKVCADRALRAARRRLSSGERRVIVSGNRAVACLKRKLSCHSAARIFQPLRDTSKYWKAGSDL